FLFLSILGMSYSFNIYASSKIDAKYSDLFPQTYQVKKNGLNINLMETKSVRWTVYKGQSLNNVLSQWANMAGWDLVWDSGQSYKLLAAASFDNISFEQAVQELFDAVGSTEPRLYVTLYKKNKVIFVSTKPGF
ncbi:TPA: hypothetical protein J1257_004642, partial [Escherichia coli]|nr:hypothetical protein [Escherichia coli]